MHSLKETKILCSKPTTGLTVDPILSALTLFGDSQNILAKGLEQISANEVLLTRTIKDWLGYVTAAKELINRYLLVREGYHHARDSVETRVNKFKKLQTLESLPDTLPSNYEKQMNDCALEVKTVKEKLSRIEKVFERMKKNISTEVGRLSLIPYLPKTLEWK